MFISVTPSSGGWAAIVLEFVDQYNIRSIHEMYKDIHYNIWAAPVAAKCGEHDKINGNGVEGSMS